MGKSVLDTVLELAGGTTQAYTRVKQGQVQRVSAYPTPVRHRTVAWSSLKPGNKVLLNGAWYQVVAVNVAMTAAQTAALKKGQQAAAAKEKAQGPSAAQKAALKKAVAASAKSAKARATGAMPPATSATAKVAAKMLRIKLRNMANGRTTVMSLAVSTPVTIAA